MCNMVCKEFIAVKFAYEQSNIENNYKMVSEIWFGALSDMQVVVKWLSNRGWGAATSLPEIDQQVSPGLVEHFDSNGGFAEPFYIVRIIFQLVGKGLCVALMLS